ncbi:hypothetical protein L3X38_026672 [Prunus dulcis]|uniref:RNase H type-1 domain-containing protein n=1 Tax=Prunus dulcis TaxID=3755 RepID=A0AAD4YZJ3_PRUDU|nr:hypothetical protein L3X38_026672 [Prunus dulcis]
MDSTSGNQLLNFMDTYSGYNQILMHENDKAKTFFIIERGTYCFKTILQSFEEWTKRQVGREYEVAFQNLKTYLTSPNLLSKPVPGENLLVYLAMSRREAGKKKIKESSRAYKTSSAEPDLPRDTCQLRVDKASNQKGAGAGVIIITPDGTLLEQAITLDFPASNNEAEYEALLVGLCFSIGLEVEEVIPSTP